MATYNLSTLKAFPSAVGHGRNTTGGRGRTVFAVTNLNDSGTGSLRTALSSAASAGGGIITFKVGGTITLASNIQTSASNLTIAGETAPGDGICIYGQQLVFTGQNIIVRHIRVRSNPPVSDHDGIRLLNNPSTGTYSNYIFDHCSVSWAKDENFAVEIGTSVNSFFEKLTLQNCIFSEGFGAKNIILWGDNISQVSVVRNLLCNTYERNIRAGTGGPNVTFEQIDNIIYNCNGGIQVEEGSDFDAIANVFRQGPTGTPNNRIIVYDSGGTLPGTTSYHISDNVIYPSTPMTTVQKWNEANGAILTSPSGTRLFASEYQSMGSSNVFSHVTSNAGARRGISGLDALDAEQVSDTLNGVGPSSFPTSIGNTSGLPTLAAGTTVVDSLVPGIPNTFVQEHGITSASQVKSTWTINGNTINNTAGYTAIEIYLFSLTGDLTLTENLVVSAVTLNTLKAFPTAYGGGALATGGRGGKVVIVNTLNNSTPLTYHSSGDYYTGGIEAAFESSAVGPRYIIFDVSGTINANYPAIYDKDDPRFYNPGTAGIYVSHGQRITVLGQTAPQGGVTLYRSRLRYKESNSNNIIRHIRIRTALYENQNSSIVGDDTYSTPLIFGGTDSIVQGCSFSWGGDKGLIMGNWWSGTLENLTSQENLVADSATTCFSVDGQPETGTAFRDWSHTKNVSWLYTVGLSSHRQPNIGGGNNSPHFEVQNCVWQSRSANTRLLNCVYGDGLKINHINNYNDCITSAITKQVYQFGDNFQIHTAGNIYRNNTGVILTGDPGEDQTIVWGSFYSPYPALPASMFTATDFYGDIPNPAPLLTAQEAYDKAINEIGKIAYVDNNGVKGTYRDSYDTLCVNNIINRVAFTENWTTWAGLLPTLPTTSRPAGYYQSVIGIPEWFCQQHGITSIHQIKTTWNFGTYDVINNAGYPAIEMYAAWIAGDFEQLLVIDPSENTAPTLNLLGSSNMVLNVGQSYVEPGYTATDAEQGNLTGSVVVTGTVNTNVAGTYQLFYNVTDSGGLSATQRVRTIQVRTPQRGVLLKGGKFAGAAAPVGYLGANKLKG